MENRIGQSGPVEDKEETTPGGRLLHIFSKIISAIPGIILVVVIVGMSVYEPSPSEYFTFSSAGKMIQLSDGRTLAYLDTGVDPGIDECVCMCIPSWDEPTIYPGEGHSVSVVYYRYGEIIQAMLAAWE